MHVLVFSLFMYLSALRSFCSTNGIIPKSVTNAIVTSLETWRLSAGKNACIPEPRSSPKVMLNCKHDPWAVRGLCAVARMHFMCRFVGVQCARVFGSLKFRVKKSLYSLDQSCWGEASTQ